VKKLLFLLLLSSPTLWAQIPPPVPAPAPAPRADTAVVAITPSSRNRYNMSEAELNKVYGPSEINFKAATLDEFLTVYAELVNRTVLRAANLASPTITLKNQTPLTKREAIQLFDAVLGINGIAMINVEDKFVKAAPLASANTEGAPFEKGSSTNLPNMGQYLTHVVQLHFVRPSEMLPVLQPFAKIPNSILPIDANQILVIRDFAENVKRMLEMIEQVDVSVPEEFISKVIPIKYALAGDIASVLSSLGGGGGGATMGGSTTGAGGARPGGTRGGSMGGRGLGMTGGLGGGMGGGMGGGLGGYSPAGTPPGGIGTMGAPGAAGGGSFTDRLRSIINKAAGPAGGAGGAGDIQIFGVTKIIADERTNSLLVYATAADMKRIEEVIAKLDVVLAQVLIESIILGVSANDDLEYGVSAAQQPKNFGPNVTTAGIMNNDKGQLLSSLGGIISSNSVANMGGLNYFGQINQDWLVAIKALSSRGKTEVLQRPVIMTTHATPGQFFVGNTVPYVTSSYYGGSSLYGPSSSYQQLRVGIQLNVTPFINPDGIVVMKIDQTIEEISGATHIDGVGDVPNTASRSLSADITVRDRDTIVLGGFIRNSGIKTKSGVPLLKDIPLLGVLFSSTSDTKDRQELLVLMRPTVLKTPELAALGSRIERDRLPGISHYEKNIEKENKEFDQKMDELDGVKPGKTPAVTPPAPTAPAVPDAQSQKLHEDTQQMFFNQAPTQPEVVQPAQPAQPAPAKKTAKKAKAPQDPFATTQPMTDDELKAYGRVPDSQPAQPGH
jgi:type II secretory pathway component GspD/PulD (secretin)